MIDLKEAGRAWTCPNQALNTSMPSFLLSSIVPTPPQASECGSLSPWMSFVFSINRTNRAPQDFMLSLGCSGSGIRSENCQQSRQQSGHSNHLLCPGCDTVRSLSPGNSPYFQAVSFPCMVRRILLLTQSFIFLLLASLLSD